MQFAGAVLQGAHPLPARAAALSARELISSVPTAANRGRAVAAEHESPEAPSGDPKVPELSPDDTSQSTVRELFETLERRSFRTYQCRLLASERLASRNR